MKHYTPMTNGDEYDLLNPKTRRYVGHSDEFLAETKRRYRKRERRALDRMVAELVVEEISDRHSIGYWESKLDDAMGELQWLDCLEECEYEDWEFYGDVEPDSRWFAAKYKEVFKSIDEAEYQLSLMGR